MTTCTERGLLTDTQHGELRPRATELVEQAYLTGSGKPAWAAVSVMHRAAHARDQLAAVTAEPGSRIAALRDRAVSDLDKQILKGQKFLAGQQNLSYQLTKDSAGVITRAEAVAVALADRQRADATTRSPAPPWTRTTSSSLRSRRRGRCRSPRSPTAAGLTW